MTTTSHTPAHIVASSSDIAAEAGEFVIPVPLSRITRIERTLEQIQRKLRRHKALDGRFSYKWGSEHDAPMLSHMEVRDRAEYEEAKREKVWVRDLHLTTSGVFVVPGWEWVGVITYMEGEGVVSLLEQIGISAAALLKEAQGGMICHHCGVRRGRNATHIVREKNTKAYKLVGSTCLRDYTGGLDPHVAALAASWIAEIRQACEEGGVGEGVAASSRTRALVATMRTISHKGWLSVSASQEKGGLPTKDLVYQYLVGSLRDDELCELLRPEPTTAELEYIGAAVEWAESLSDESVDASDYLLNLRTVSRCASCPDKWLGVLVSLLPAYEREISKRETAARRAVGSAHVGEVGKKTTQTVVYEGSTSHATYYGVSHLCRFRTVDGAEVVWWASNPPEMEKGATYTLTGTVKAHGEYKGVKQTTLTRCKVK